MSSAEKIKRLFAKSDITVDSKLDDRIINDALTAFAKPEKTQSVSSGPNIWRITMKSPITKLASAAVIIISVVFLITFFDKTVTPAYALEQTIEANHTIKTVHLRIFWGAESIENNEFSDYWIKYNDAGKLSSLRCNEHDKDGVVRFTVWNEGIKKTWIPENNVVIINRLNNTDKEWKDFAKDLDPQLFLQWLYDESKEKEEIELTIDEPAEDSNSIYVKATHSVLKERLELVVYRKTKLIKKFSHYHLREHGDELNAQVEYLAYNQPIDPSMFELSGIPDNAEVINQGKWLVGLEKGDLTNKEIAAKVVREALEATIAKDYDEVSRLMECVPGDTIEEFIEKEFEARFVRIISIGQPEPNEKFRHILCVPCEIEVEEEERGRWRVNIIATAKSIGYQPPGRRCRWIMHTDLRVSEPYIPSTDDHGDSDTPDSGKSIMLNEQPPGPIIFPKIDRKPNPFIWLFRGEMKSLPKYDPNLDRSWQVDLRSYDLTKLDLRNSIEDLMYADFDDRTVWPAPNRMPSNFDWQKIMELGKNPGLGIRSLHKKGITGRGVRVAILDPPLLVDHQEYVERLRLYEEIDLQGLRRSTTRGAAVASIAVGKTVGVAPEAELYYIAQLNVDRDKGTPTLRSLAKGIHRMLEINEQLPKENKIRVISMSGGWTRSHKDYKEITEAVQKARAAGMLVVCASVELVHDGFAFGLLGRSPLADPEVFESYEPGIFLSKHFRARQLSLPEGHFWAPMDSRTTASPGGSDEYVFCRVGGVSWTIPYIAGLYALAVQVDPAITPERFWDLAAKTGRTIELEHKGERRSFGPIIDPVALISTLQKK